MIDHPFISVLKTFTDEEMRDFTRFLESPYFNRSETAAKSLKIILEFYPDIDNEHLTKQYLYHKLNIAGTFKDSTVRAILFDLLRLSERFLKQCNFDNSRYGTNVHLLDELLLRGLTELFPRNSKLLESSYVEDERIEGAYFLDKYQYGVDKFNYDVNFGNASNVATIKSNLNTLSAISKDLWGYFVIELMKIHDNIVTYSLNYGLDVSQNSLAKIISNLNLEKILAELKTVSEENNFAFDIYYYLHKCFLDFENEEYYFEYKRILLENSDSISKNEKQFLYGKLLDYCILKNKKHNNVHNFRQELFEIYEIVLIYEYYKHSTNIYLPVPWYRVILLLALDMQKFDWLELFVNFYLSKVRPDQQENLYNYTYALLNFEKKEYVNSLEYMMKVDYDHFSFRLDMKNLLLKIYYELGYTESVFSLIDCYKHFISRNKLVSPTRKMEHGNFINIVQKLLKMQVKEDYENAGFLLTEMKKMEQLESRTWLTGKVSELSKKYRRAV